MRLGTLLSLLTTLLLARAVSADDTSVEVVSTELGRRYDDALLRRAASADAEKTRLAAARAAGRLRNSDALAWLIPMFKDESGRVRRAALFAAGQIGSEDAVIPLRESLAKTPRNDLPHALEALGKTGDPRAVSTVTGYLRHADTHVREQAALALFRLGDTSALPDLAGALQAETDAEARWRQVYSMARLLRNKARKAKRPVTGDATWSALLALSTDPSRPFYERTFAASGLGALAGNGKRLFALTKDPDDRVVVAAVRALSADPDAPHAKALLPLLKNPDFLVQDAVVTALERWGKKAAPALRDAAPLVEKQLRMRVNLALLAAGRPIHHPTLSRSGTAPSEVELEFAWRVIPWANGAFPVLGKTDSVATRRVAAEMCGNEKVEREHALITLRELLKTKDFTVQSMAISALADREAKREIPRIVATARAAAGPEWIDVRLEAAGALKKLEVYDPWLDEAATDDPEPIVRAAARDTLAALKRPLPPVRPRAGFRLSGLDARGVLDAARALQGARVRLRTNRGVMTMVLLPDEAPAHCVNFAKLVSSGFYDKKTWHRVVADFVIQGGCPRGDGWGGPGYFLPDEIGTRPYVRGTVGMPRSGVDTGGCQIFITHLPTPHLDGRYSVYAQVVEGLDVIDKIRVGDTIEKATLLVRE
jgi:cyclophilin family peptidyl-prolyl cis-trans isomerase/HEAT repeat protein